jgi:hypothetical protein
MLTPLDPQRHAKTCIRSLPDLAYAATQNHAIVGLDEMPSAAADYPLAFLKHSETGRFNVVALYGFEPSRNLYVMNDRWNAIYVPLTTLRYPFSLSAAGTLGLAIDEDCAELDTDGNPLFDARRSPTPYARRIAALLASMHRDFEAMQAFCQTLADLRAIRPLELLLKYQDGQESKLDGLYTVSRTALATAHAEDILRLHRLSYLSAAHAMMHSLMQLTRLRQLHDLQSQQRILDLKMVLRE